MWHAFAESLHGNVHLHAFTDVFLPPIAFLVLVQLPGGRFFLQYFFLQLPSGGSIELSLCLSCFFPIKRGRFAAFRWVCSCLGTQPRFSPYFSVFSEALGYYLYAYLFPAGCSTHVNI